VHDYLIAQGIKGSFGVITESLEKDNPMYFQWLKDVQAAGRIELWMHGYKMRGVTDTGEFENGTAAEQRAILAKGERLAKEKLGFDLPAFGPHWSGTTDATDEAMEGVPEVKIWLYGPAWPTSRPCSINSPAGMRTKPTPCVAGSISLAWACPAIPSVP
jgi:hypothetical protein